MEHVPRITPPLGVPRTGEGGVPRDADVTDTFHNGERIRDPRLSAGGPGAGKRVLLKLGFIDLNHPDVQTCAGLLS